MNWSADTVPDVPPGVVIVMSIVPAVPEGEVTVQVVALEQLTEVAALAPNLAVVTVVPATNPVPLTVTPVPPPSGPMAGDTAVTVGTGR